MNKSYICATCKDTKEWPPAHSEGIFCSDQVYFCKSCILSINKQRRAATLEVFGIEERSKS